MGIPYRYDSWVENGYVGRRVTVTPPIVMPFVCPDCNKSCKIVCYIFYRNHQLWKGCHECEYAAKEKWMDSRVKKRLLEKFKKVKKNPEAMFDVSKFQSQKKGHNVDSWV